MGVKVREKPPGSGVWWIFVNHRGKRKSKRIGAEKTAREVAAKIEARLVLGEYNLDEAPSSDEAPTFGQMADKWLALQIKPDHRATTYQRYRGVLDTYVRPIIGKVPVADLKRGHVVRVLRDIRAKGLSRSSVETARNVISGTCEFAIDEEHMVSNPATGAMRRIGMKRSSSRKTVTVFTRDEAALILETCQARYPDWYPFFLAAFRTGARLGELLALRWENVNWRERYIVIEQSFRNSRLTATKTGKVRRIDMSDQLAATLKELYLKRKREALKAGGNEVEPIIFHTGGQYTSQNSVRNVWRRLLTKAGLDYRKFHTIRHTVTSLLLSSGQPLNYVKETLGHQSIQVTVDTYSHFLPSESPTTISTLDDAPTRTLSAPDQKESLATG